MPPAVECTQASKWYPRAEVSLHRTLSAWLRRGPAAGVWALRDLTFTISPGESLGIAGRNGSGKTTLLRLLAGVTSPTRGRVGTFGAVRPMIGLETSLHPELTAAENVVLLGTLLGLTARASRAKLPGILAFAELSDRAAVPLKRYSAGQRVRLSFAVALHTDPEILLVDEVLAVGDAAFQEKCLGALVALQRQGVTIAAVSHSPDLLGRLCARTLWLDSGECRALGPTPAVLSAYAASLRVEVPA